MAQAELKCPSCGRAVQLGDIECAHCGVNLKSGESFEARVKRARGKAKHPEKVTGGLYLGLAGVFVLMSLAGYFYQRRIENVVEQRPDMFVERIERIQHVHDLIYAERYAEAREEAEALSRELRRAADDIEPPEPFAPADVRQRGRRADWDERAGKGLLHNLATKAERLVEEIPEAGAQQ